jgi:glutamate N-acetyltransferase / amino-acid N-acetyltransferase
MNDIEGGVTAARGFAAGAVLAGIKKGRTKKDLALIVSEVPAAAAACYTTNVVKGAPLQVTKEHLAGGQARAVIVNSGNANTCNGPQGIEHARDMARFAASRLGIAESEVIVASTGVIGQPLPINVIEQAMDALVADVNPANWQAACEAIMTTDTQPKIVAVEFDVGGKAVRLGAMCKGSGMIHPNMATMLSFITTDCSISAPLLQKALSESVKKTYNMVSVDGDTSTNDMVCALANGLAGNLAITAEGPEYRAFAEALDYANTELAKKIAADGEGASRLLTCVVRGARTVEDARVLARSVISSDLTKAAFFGSDANWGRVLCALGYSGVNFDPEKASVSFSSKAGRIDVCKDGQTTDFDEDRAKEILLEKEILVEVGLAEGSSQATAWGCDLTYDYVKINGDYRS